MRLVPLILLLMIGVHPGPVDGPVDLKTLSDTLTAVALPEVSQTVQAEPEIHANELGEVPILMYHRIKEGVDSYDTAPDTFRSDLERLHEAGFVLIDLEDYLNGIVAVPAGKHPVAITFDDGSQSQFNLIEAADGEVRIDPDCAVGILYSFFLQHPDFGFEATFFVNGGVPFGQADLAERKLEFIRRYGLTLANHTLRHENLAQLETPMAILSTVEGNETAYSDRYGVTLAPLLAIPFGSYPSDMTALGILDYPAFKVGWKPERSVFDKGFDRLRIHRVQSGSDTFQFGYWMDWFEEHPESLYTSDGNPKTLSVPEAQRGDIAPQWTEKLEIIPVR